MRAVMIAVAAAVALLTAGASAQGGRERGDCNSATGEFAIRVCTRLIDSSRVTGADLVAVLKDRAYNLTLLNRFPDALRDYDRAVALAPKDADAHYFRGATLRVLKQYPRAISRARSRTTTAPSSSCRVRDSSTASAAWRTSAWATARPPWRTTTAASTRTIRRRHRASPGSSA